MGSFGEKRKKLFFRFCRPILDTFGFPLLTKWVLVVKKEKSVFSLLWADSRYFWISALKDSNNCSTAIHMGVALLQED